MSQEAMDEIEAFERFARDYFARQQANGKKEDCGNNGAVTAAAAAAARTRKLSPAPTLTDMVV